MVRTTLLTLVAIALSSCVDPMPQVSLRRSPIQGGSEEPGFSAVGVLASGSGRCTATLIGRRSVLTAAHCIKTTTLSFTLCPSTAACSSSAGTTYQGPATKFPGWTGDNTNDLAVVHLAQEVQGVEPVAINTAALAQGQAITIVGYGLPGFGTKRSGSNTISVLRGTNYQFASLPNVDSGDSGGPTFVAVGGEQLVAGVHSTKGTGGGTDIRCDAFESWILDVTEGDTALPGVGLPPGGNALPGPGTEGETCFDRACDAGLACVTVYDSTKTVERGKYCMEVCQSPGAADPICDGAEQCVDSQSAGPVCFASDRADTGFTDPGDGSGGETAPPPSEEPALPPSEEPALPPSEEPAPPPSEPAPPTAEPSPPAEDPTPPSEPPSLPEVPAPAPAAPAPGAFGADCASGTDCDSGLCAEQEGEDGSFCTIACEPSEDCPGVARCVPAGGADDVHVCSAPLSGGAHALDGTAALYGGCQLGGKTPVDRGALLLLALWLVARRRAAQRS